MSSSATEVARKRMLIVGYGNPLRGDDAAGCAAADRLFETIGERVNVRTLHQLTPELAADAALVDELILIDAAADLPPGQVRWQQVEVPAASADLRPHHLDPAQLLLIARTLFGHAPATTLITIGGHSWGYDTPLSPPVERAVQEVVAALVSRASCSCVPTSVPINRAVEGGV
jgi:hydrogenase maturation protease